MQIALAQLVSLETVHSVSRNGFLFDPLFYGSSFDGHFQDALSDLGLAYGFGGGSVYLWGMSLGFGLY